MRKNPASSVVSCSICSASSFDVDATILLCDACACLYLCRTCATHHHPRSECARLCATRQAAVDSGFYEFPFAWYPPRSMTFGSLGGLLEYVGVTPNSAVARLLGPASGPTSSRGSTFPFPVEDSATHDSYSIVKGVMQHMEAFWGTEGNAFFLGTATTDPVAHPQALDGVPGDPPPAMGGWDAYLSLRPDSDTFPLILDSAMTVYAAVARYRRRASMRLQRTHVGGVKIALVGVEVDHEVRYWPTFIELFNVLPDMHTIHLVMVGPELPTAVNGLKHTVRISNERKLVVEMHQTDCEDSAGLLADCHVVCALNAGLPAYHSWESGLLAIKKSAFGGVLVVTDLVEEALYLGRHILLRVFGDAVGEVEVNGFRRPDACVRPNSHAMPSCGGNAFACFVDC